MYSKKGRNMKSIRYILFALSLPVAISMSAQKLAGSQVQIDNKTVTMSADAQVMVGMDVTVPADMELTTNCKLALTPILVSKDNANNKVLPAIYVYGRIREVVDRRDKNLPEDAFAVLRRDNGTAQTINYASRVPYEKWMNGADLKLMGEIHGCADCLKEEDLAQVVPVLLERYAVQPAIAFVTPAVEAVKNRTEEGRAYLDFPVNKTTIYPEYRRNPQELAAIKRTIDVVKENDDTEITGISIHGYASPEGGYANNTRLAKGRAEALKNYVMKEYGLKASMFTINSTPEDWAGLRAYVEKNNVPLKDKILAIIDNDDTNYDVKENRIKTLDMTVYRSLLKDCYPALRHSDYVVQYVVRAYTDINEIKEILKKRPQLLSLEEMFRVAQTYETGSEDFNEVFDVAVRMFPSDPTANINAAAMELQRGNLQQALRYLDRSDVSAGTTQNNWGVLHLLKGEWDKAEACFKKAQSLGIAEAETNLEELRKKREDNAAFGE